MKVFGQRLAPSPHYLPFYSFGTHSLLKFEASDKTATVASLNLPKNNPDVSECFNELANQPFGAIMVFKALSRDLAMGKSTKMVKIPQVETTTQHSELSPIFPLTDLLFFDFNLCLELWSPTFCAPSLPTDLVSNDGSS